MKIVINRCFGGFSLSNEAFELLLNKKHIRFERVRAKSALRKELNEYDYYEEGYAGLDNHYLWEFNLCEDRSDPHLVAVVEELGEKANGWASDLTVVEIPDDVEWYIEEYDGREHVAEVHRTWS